MLLALTTAALALVLGPGVAAALDPPTHHPQHSAPPELLARIAGSNPSILIGDHHHHRSSPRFDSSPPTAAALPPSHYRRPPTRGVGSSRVSPLDFGADPTGRTDSWRALDAALQHCLNQSKLSPNGYFPGEDSTPSFGPIRDMGGCDIDLGGGEFRISRPLVLPEMNANMQFGRGSLVASPDFAGDFLFVVGVDGSCEVPQGSCNIDINFPELFLDGAHVASGMQINNVMGVTIGPGGYFLNFTQYGLQINRTIF
jgi:hypothetical protein